ncbi:MAG: caspase family protein [Deltaproteobacteria bacterium]|nr:caspase family protein [Deltaproteobacteria bacterium]
MGTFVFRMRGQAPGFLICLLVYLYIVSVSFPAAAARSGKISLRLGVYPPSLKTHIQITEPSGNQILDAGEKGTILVTIKNEGNGEAFGVEVGLETISIPKGLYFPSTLSVGTIAAGTEKTVTIPISADREVETGSCKIGLRVREKLGFDADPITLSFTTKEFIPPNLQVADVGIRDFTQDGRIEPGETVEVVVRVANEGGAKAQSVRAEVAMGENVFVMPDSMTMFGLGDLAPSEYKDITFSFVTNKRIQGETVPITVKIQADRPEDGREIKLKQLALYRREGPSEEIELPGTGEDKPPRSPGVATFAVDVDLEVPEGKVENRYGIAVIIGNKDYRSRDVPPVDYAIRDGEVVKEYVEKTMGYRPGNIIYVENATQANFRAIFGSETDHRGKLFDYVRPGGQSDVFVYYSGHGAPDPSGPTGYFVPVDCDPSMVRLNGYSLQIFSKNLSKIPAKSLTVVLDACFSGGYDRGNLIRNVSPVYFDVGNPLAVLKNAVVFTSSSGDQVSTWYPEKRHGLFTYFFLKGLQLRDAVDKNRDGKLNADELFAFIQEEVSYMARRLASREQHPQLIGNPDSTVVTLE